MKGPVLFQWDHANLDHIARHGYLPGEVEDVFSERFLIRRGRDGRYLVYGPTSDGRMTVVVCTRKPGSVVRVITARAMNETERRRYRRS